MSGTFATGVGATLLFITCAPTALALMGLASRLTENRWPIRVILTIPGAPLAGVVLHFLEAAV